MKTSYSENRGNLLRLIESQYPDASIYLRCFYDRSGASVDQVVAELPYRNPAVARIYARSLKVLLEKRDIPWRCISVCANISWDRLPNEEAAWNWVAQVIDVLEGNVAQKHRDFWKENRDKACFLWAEESARPLQQ